MHTVTTGCEHAQTIPACQAQEDLTLYSSKENHFRFKLELVMAAVRIIHPQLDYTQLNLKYICYR